MKDNNKKFLYCPHCLEYPDKIKNEYRDPIIEKRNWCDGCYELYESNINDTEYKELCDKCGTKLIYKEQK